MVFNRQRKTVNLGHKNTILRHMGLLNRKEDEIHEIFYRGVPWQFYRGLFGRSRGSAATRGFAQTVRGKIAMGLRVKYFMNLVFFRVAIVTDVLFGLVLT